MEGSFKVVVILTILNWAGGCKTNYGWGEPCVFPYKFKGEIFFTCTVHIAPKKDGVVPMCPTKVDPRTLEAPTNASLWGLCDEECPMRSYLSNSKLQETLKSLSIFYPNLAQRYPLKYRSVLGEELMAMKITANSNRKRPILKPMVRLIANMHGNEVIGRELLVQLARVLVLGYEYDRRIKKIMDKVELHILPTMNPDGFNRAKEGECGGQNYQSGRWNENKVDLNRDFPAWYNLMHVHNKSGNYMNKLLKSKQPETKAVAKWMMDEPWLLGANLHDGAVVASYPWDHYVDERKSGDHFTDDDDVYRDITDQYASDHLTMKNSSVCKKYAYLGPTTNGAAWYPKNGTLKDFGHMMSPALEFVFELSCCKYPNDYFLPREFENNRESLLGFLERAMTGVRGLVLDLRGRPLPGAKVIFEKVSGGSAGKSVITSDRGEFWKILVPGKYRLTAVKDDCVQSGGMPVNISRLAARRGSRTVKLYVRRKFNCIRK